MKGQIELSVIIPCYNVEKYIKACLDSIIQQECSPREIILIDDGSTDNTAEIIKNHIPNSSSIHYFYQQNGGVGEARNAGIKKATSKYIQFVDPDDLIDCNFYESLGQFINRNNSIDLLYFNYSPYKNGPIQYKLFCNSNNFLIDTGNGYQLIDFLLAQNKFTGACWRYLFKKDLITHEFEGRVHEDHLFSLRLIFAAKKTCYLSKNVYYYRVRENSLSHSQKSPDYIDAFYDVLKQALKLIHSSPISEKSKQLYQISMVTFYLSAMFSCNEKKDNNLKLIYGYFELLYRIDILNKKGFIKNLIFIQKLSKKVNYSWSDRFKLIKCLYTGKYPQSIHQFGSNLI